ncbi:hypothetical protein RJ639_009461, partial [Escallonia herrerae]
APRWASVNLGIFICIQCSGIHRSLGVHISKVRSATLDTWLPDQIASMQSMGNERSNGYWEAELPPSYDRVGIENFIRAKYVDKRWISRDGKAKSPSNVGGEKVPDYKQRPKIRDGIGYASSTERFPDEGRRSQLNNTNSSVPAPKSSNPRVSEQVTPHPGKKDVQKSEPTPKAELVKRESNSTLVVSASKVESVPVISAPKVDYAADLFNLLCVDDHKEDGSRISADNGWAGPHSATAPSKSDNCISLRGAESKNQIDPHIEDLFEGLEWVQSHPQKPPTDVKIDIMNLFEKSSMVSPFAVHQQQLAMVAQQRSFLTAATAKHSGAPQTVPANWNGVGFNGMYIPAQNWGSIGNQGHGTMKVAEQQKLMQVEPVKRTRESSLISSSFFLSVSLSSVLDGKHDTFTTYW